MSNARERRRSFWEGLRVWWREVSRSYCERAVRASLAAAPLGGHDWFLEGDRAR